MIGFGDPQARFKVYVKNRPKMPQYQLLESCEPLLAGDIDHIYQHCGNGWRKLFNVYAKLRCALDPTLLLNQPQMVSWQQYRDQSLLQQNSDTALLFDAPVFMPAEPVIHLIAGRTHAKGLISHGLTCQLHWINSEFAMDPINKVIVTPFFDYRQLNNDKIGEAVHLLQTFRSEGISRL